MRETFIAMWLRIRALGARSKLERDLRDEIAFHLVLREEKKPDRNFGNPVRLREDLREMWTFHKLEMFFTDAMLALRTMSRNPAFTLTAILTLAVGIGGNTAMFTVIRAVLLKPLAYRDPDRLVHLSIENNRNLVTFTPVRYEELRNEARSFSAIGGYGFPEKMTLAAGPDSQLVSVARVSANFTGILGLRPLLGRGFLPEEDRPGARPVAMISERMWQQLFGRSPRTTAESATLDFTSYAIIGVLPASFQFPFPGVDVWLTQPSQWSGVPAPARERTATITCFARLKSGVGIERAAGEIAVLNRRYIAAHPGMPDAAPKATVRVAKLSDDLVMNVRLMLWLLFGSVAFVLLVACANVANLVLARSAARRREFAVRTALGAARGRLIAQLLTESSMLAIAGGATGLCLALLILR